MFDKQTSLSDKATLISMCPSFVSFVYLFLNTVEKEKSVIICEEIHEEIIVCYVIKHK